MKAIARLLWPAIEMRSFPIITKALAQMRAEIDEEIILLLEHRDDSEDVLKFFLNQIEITVDFSLKEDDPPKRWYNLTWPELMQREKG